MYLGGMFLGLTSFEGGNVKSDPVVFNKILLNGKQTAYFTQAINKKMTPDEIKAVFNSEPIYTPETVFLAKYKKSLHTGNTEDLDSPILLWRVFRKSVDSGVSKFIGEVPAKTTSIIDYTAQARATYTYDILGVTADKISHPVASAPFKTVFFGMFIIDEITNQVLHLNLNLNSGTLNSNNDVTTHNGFGKYSTVAIGKRDYFNASVKCFGGEKDINGKIVNDLAYQENLRQFLNNGNVKIIKNSFGNAFRAKTYGGSIQYDDEIGEQPFSVAFNFIEVGEI